jgi:hypothetical protein
MLKTTAAVIAALLFAGTASAEPVKTSKERLSDKANDEQRVDNCGVAPERRGPAPRPDCPSPATPPRSVEPGPPEPPRR